MIQMSLNGPIFKRRKRVGKNDLISGSVFKCHQISESIFKHQNTVKIKLSGLQIQMVTVVNLNLDQWFSTLFVLGPVLKFSKKT